LGLFLVAGVAANGSTGTSPSDAVWVSCGNPVSGKLKPGERVWLAFKPLQAQSTGVAMAFGPLVDVYDKTADKTGYFKVWVYLNPPTGPILKEIGKGTTKGEPWALKTWRGGQGDLANRVHYLEVINPQSGEIDYNVYLDCRWPVN